MTVIETDSIRGFWDVNTLTCVECERETEATADRNLDHVLLTEHMDEEKRYFCDKCKREILS